MPTSAEFKELFDNCTNVWTSINGVVGALLTSNVNGKTLFLPAAGNYVGTSLTGRGTYGSYWSSTYFSASNAYDLGFNSSAVGSQNNSSRRYGFSVRPVYKE